MRREAILSMTALFFIARCAAVDIFLGVYNLWRNDELIAPTNSGEFASFGIAVDPITEKAFLPDHVRRSTTAAAEA